MRATNNKQAQAFRKAMNVQTEGYKTLRKKTLNKIKISTKLTYCTCSYLKRNTEYPKIRTTNH